MNLLFRSLNRKALTLMTIIRKFHPNLKIEFIHDQNTLIETLAPSQNKEPQFCGILSILAYLESQIPSFLDKIYWASFGIVELIRTKTGPVAPMKIIRNKNLKKLNKLLLNSNYLSGAELGSLDVVAYLTMRKYFKGDEKTTKFVKLTAWLEKLKDKIDPEVDAIISQFKNIPQKKGKKEEQKEAPQGKKEEPKKKGKQAEQKEQPKAQNEEPKQKEKEESKASKESKPKENQKGAKEKAPAKEKVKEKPVQQPKESKKKPQEDLDPEYLKEFNSAKIKRLSHGKEILPEANKRNILVTSALPYVNNVPHLGNVIGCVLSADVFARYSRLRGYNTIYVAGTDEYGAATEMKALQEKCTPQQICDKYFAQHKKIYDWFDIDCDNFGRTTTPEQTKIAQDIFLKLHENKFLFPETLEQSYCENCKTFLADRFIRGKCPHCSFDDAKGDQCDGCGKLLNPTELVEPKCQICSKQPVVKQAKHVFIDLPQLQESLEKWIAKASEAGFWNNNSKTTTQSWIKTGLKARCITRDLKWGTPVPLEEFKDKVFYVWFDAPIGYLSITATYTKQWEKWWKNPDQVKLYQFMGKDNIPFHTVIFPCTLLGTKENWTMLHHISTTEYLNYEDGKFSKSRGVGVFGDNAMETQIPCEIWRYYLLTNRPEKADTLFTWKDFGVKINNELLTNIGNLTQRSLKLIFNKFEAKIPSFEKAQLTPADLDCLKNIYSLFKEYLNLFESVEIKEALKLTMEISAQCNKYMQDNEPWVAKNIESGRSNVVLAVVVNLIRALSALFEPFMPSLSAKINFLLHLEKRTERDEALLEYLEKAGDFNVLLTLVPSGHVINKPVVLIQEVKEDVLNRYKECYSGKQIPTTQN